MFDTDTSRPFPGSLADWRDDLRLAAGFLTRIVPPPSDAAAARPLAEAARAFPLVGAALGAGAGAVYAIAAGLGLTPALAAVCALAALVPATGALHEDGLSDTADGLGGGVRRGDKLAIMRDSRSGTYGVVAVTLCLVARIAALAALAEPVVVLGALAAAGAASRAAIPAVMLALPAARNDGLGAAAGRPGQSDVALGGAIALVVALIGLDLATAIVALVAGGLAAAAVGSLARRQIGGHTGDILGAVQQLCEVAILFAVVAL